MCTYTHIYIYIYTHIQVYMYNIRKQIDQINLGKIRLEEIDQIGRQKEKLDRKRLRYRQIYKYIAIDRDLDK